jgi:hypothetical protein
MSNRDWATLDRAALFVGLVSWTMSLSDKVAGQFGYQIDNLDTIGAAVGLGFVGFSLIHSVLAPASREQLWDADRKLLPAYVRLAVGVLMLVTVVGLGTYYAIKRWPYQ